MSNVIDLNSAGTFPDKAFVFKFNHCRFDSCPKSEKIVPIRLFAAVDLRRLAELG